MAKKNNKLNLNVIKNANQKQFTQKTITITVDDVDYEVKIDQNFRTTKIEKMVNSLVKSENLKKFGEMDESVKISYYMFLIIREFSDLDIPNNLKFEEEINLISSLIDLGIFEKIMAEIPESEIMKINDYLQKFNMNLNKALEEMNEGKNIDEFTFNENVITNDDENNNNKSGDEDGK